MAYTPQPPQNTPSLVGSLVRLVDDDGANGAASASPSAAHRRPRLRPPAKGAVVDQRGALIDELAQEGALMGDDEYQFLGSQGEVVAAEQAPVHVDEDGNDLDQRVAQLAINLHKNRGLAPELTAEEAAPKTTPKPVAASSNNIYLAPDLSEYQLDHQIHDHSLFVSLLESPHNPKKLPGYVDHQSPAPTQRALVLRTPLAPAQPLQLAPPQVNVTDTTDGLHTPYWHTDRDLLRSRVRDSLKGRLPLNLRLTGRRHLARGDNYKTVHDELPLGYEMPGNLEPPAEDDGDGDDDRVTRHGKRTMLEKLQIAESALAPPAFGGLRDPLLVTLGDYTNFNVDLPHAYDDRLKLNAQQRLALASYLRLISRLRSRPAARREACAKDEADPSELVREGALVNDDYEYAAMGIQEEAEQAV